MSKIDYKKLSEKLGDIPTKQDVIKECKRIEKIKWFKPLPNPINPFKSKIQLKVNSILTAFKLDFRSDIEFHTLKKSSDWASARASAWESAWDSAWASAWDSARASAWDSARDSARASARASAWASAWDSARASAWDSARASARDSAGDSAWEVVKDLQEKKGYKQNPYKLLIDLWKIGLYPTGVLKDKKFHIWYVPKK